MRRLRIGLIGGGWRASSYQKVICALKDNFSLVGFAEVSSSRREYLKKIWQVPGYSSGVALYENEKPEIIVSCIPSDFLLDTAQQLIPFQVPQLLETIPAKSIEWLRTYYQTLSAAPVQIAEQYPLRPAHQAKLAVTRSGLLGKITQVQMSLAHEYHGISLIRKYLNLSYEPCKISAQMFSFPVMTGYGRQGPPDAERIESDRQMHAILDFGKNGFAILDFSDEQYFSPIRTPHMIIRGQRGEIVDDQICYMKDFHTPCNFSLTRRQNGGDNNAFPYTLISIEGNSRTYFLNSLAPLPLSDDELAIAFALLRMGKWISGDGPCIYSLEDACQDQYLGLLARTAIQTGRPQQSREQPWMVK